MRKNKYISWSTMLCTILFSVCSTALGTTFPKLSYWSCLVLCLVCLAFCYTMSREQGKLVASNDIDGIKDWLLASVFRVLLLTALILGMIWLCIQTLNTISLINAFGAVIGTSVVCTRDTRIRMDYESQLTGSKENKSEE